MRERGMSTANYQDVVAEQQKHTKSCKSAGKVLHLKRSQSAQREEVKAALRIWLESVRARSGDSWEQIGVKSSVSPTNITRFMKPGSISGIGIETIRKVAATYGIAPPSELSLDFLASPGFSEPERSAGTGSRTALSPARTAWIGGSSIAGFWTLTAS